MFGIQSSKVLSIDVNVNRLRMQAFFDGLQAALTTIATLLPASPRRLLTREVGAVDRDCADLELRSDPQPARDVGCKDDTCSIVSADRMTPFNNFNLPDRP